MSGLDRRLPSIPAMERAAARRVPRFAFEYLQGGIGAEACLAANRTALDRIELVPRYIPEAPLEPDLSTPLFGDSLAAPFAPGPVGLSGLMWPRAAEHIAAAAVRHALPVGLSTLATSSIEEIAAIAGERLWFQLYCPNVVEIENDLIDLAEAAGCKGLIVTVDIPTVTRREREIANGLSVPPHFDLTTVLQIATRPRWALQMLRAGVPRFRTVERYVPHGASRAEAAQFLAQVIEGHVTAKKLERIRARWSGRLVVKGILTADDARLCRALGADALVVSNHGGRQLDAAPTAPAVLPVIREAVGPDLPLVVDGGVRSGLDVARLIACGADFVLLARAFVYAVAAAGAAGVDHAMLILKEELRHTMAQTGCARLSELPGRRP